ncbi:cysteine hydrolase [Candidatus Bathyarchaeota archaeon]|nr:cysteine hydrolase [Candidatus Bathyarchaeota archaeon]
MENKAIIIIDMLNDFVTGDLKSERGQRIVPKLKKLVETARKKGIPVIYSNDAHLPEDPEVVYRWGKHAIRGTKGAEVIPELKPTKKDYVLEKRTYSGFFETGLDSLLRSLYHGEGVKTVILGGLHTNICVRHTAADAFFRGYKIIIAKDGVEAFTPREHKEGLKYLENIYNAKIMPVDKILKELK